MVPDDDFDDEIAGFAARLAGGPTLAYARTKHAFNLTSLSTPQTALAVEREGQGALLDTDDVAEGVRALTE